MKRFLSFYWLLRISIALMVLVIAIGIHVLLNDAKFMPLKNIEIDATYQHVKPKVIARIVEPYIQNQGLFSANVTGLKQALLTQPWIDKVVVRRIWPGTLSIEITEQRPIARWNNHDLLNAQAEVFTPAKLITFTDLPQLMGPEGQQQLVLQQWQQINTLLAPLTLNVKELDLNQRHAWRAVLNDNTVLVLGKNDVLTRVNNFVTAYPKIFSPPVRLPKTIDLRYENGLAVRWSSNS